MKKKRIKNISFKSEGCHLAYTDWSQGGAASMENVPVLMKGKDVPELTPEQKKLLERYGEEFKPLVIKSIEIESTESLNKTSSSSQQDGAEDDNNDENLKGNKMSEDILKQLEEYKAQNEKMAKTLKAIETKNMEDKVSKYSLPEDLTKSLVELVLSVSEESSEVVFKAMDSLVEAKEKIAKSAKETTETDLARALGAEVGSDPTSKQEELSQADKIMKNLLALREESK